MARSPEGNDDEPVGGRAAERLRQHLRARFPEETVEELDPVPDERERDEVEAGSAEPDVADVDQPEDTMGREPGSGG